MKKAYKNYEFHVKYKSLLIGYLHFNHTDDFWIFMYSDEFKKQCKIAPIFDFSDLDRAYSSSEL